MDDNINRTQRITLEKIMNDTILTYAHRVFLKVRFDAMIEGCDLRESTARGYAAKALCIQNQFARLAKISPDVSFHAANGITVSD